jgi:hypothetical protein
LEDVPPARYEHDCDECVYLGHDGRADLYFCPQPLFSQPTIIARHSSEPSDYLSGLAFRKHRPLATAYRRAVAAGLITEIVEKAVEADVDEWLSAVED